MSEDLNNHHDPFAIPHDDCVIVAWAWQSLIRLSHFRREGPPSAGLAHLLSSFEKPLLSFFLQ